jgi:hypothetical protein
MQSLETIVRTYNRHSFQKINFFINIFDFGIFKLKIEYYSFDFFNPIKVPYLRFSLNNNNNYYIIIFIMGNTN